MKLPRDLEAKVLSLAGVAPAKAARKPRVVTLAAPARWSVTLYPACRVVTESNFHEHWRTKAARVKAQRQMVWEAWVVAPLGAGWEWRANEGGLRVTLTHIGPEMDSDNLQSAFKAVRDEVAARIGTDDGSPFYEWKYEQKLGPAGVEIRIESR